jgi:hypothetical protein
MIETPLCSRRCLPSNLMVFLRVLGVLYVQNDEKTVYCSSPCAYGDEASEESCEHGDWPTTDRVSAFDGRA